MMRTLSLGLVVALFGAAFLPGCGGGSKSSSTGSAANSETTTKGQGGSAGNGQGGTSSGGTTSRSEGPRPSLTPQQNVETCQRIVQAPSTLTAEQKAKLLKSCQKAGTGAAAQHQVIHELCEAVASRQSSPANRQRLLAVCRRLP
jgi:hypothetical protein